MTTPNKPYASPKILHTEPLGPMETGYSGDQSCEAGPGHARKIRRAYERPRVLQSMPLDEAGIEW